MSQFKWGTMVGFQEAGLSYHDILAHTGHAAMKAMHLWNQWIEEDCMQR
jgi:hypothetical protein